MRFHYKKAVQVVNYLTNLNGGSIDKLSVLKLIYLADRYHLRNYIRTVTKDKYIAMRQGPVASSTKDLIEQKQEYLTSEALEYSQSFIEYDPQSFKIKSKSDVDEMELSDSDKEALNYIFDNYGKLDSRQLVNLTHQYPEWKKREKELNDENKCIEINMLDFFEDPEGEIDPLGELDKEDREASIDYYKELAYLQSLLS